jgi:hypothetical protein
VTEFTTRIIKGGALLPETRRMLEVWEDEMPIDANLDRIRTFNLLGQPSRKRTEDTLQILRQRFIDPGEWLLPVLRVLTSDSSAFRDACYFEATRNDYLLAYTAEQIRSGGKPPVAGLCTDFFPPIETLASWRARLTSACPPLT